MGRKHSTNHNLPNGMRARKRHRANGKIIIYYYYESRTADGKRREIPLGTDYVLAVQQWAKLEHDKIRAHDRATYNTIATRYKAEILPQSKSANTLRNKKLHLNRLDEFFNNAPLDEIQPQHIRQYYDWRRNTPAAANNEMSTFSDMWNHAREWGYTDRANPVQGVKRFEIKRRDNYIENDLYQLVYQAAEQQLRDLMDIAYLTGQRPIDIVKLHSNDIHNGYLHITQQKTKAKLRFEITGDLKTIFDRIIPETPDYLFHNQKGGSMNRSNLTKAFKTLRDHLIQKYPEHEIALKNFQFRDLRAKSATDVYLNSTLTDAKEQLGHTSEKMTQTYVRKAKPRVPIRSVPKK
ncbi:tyrosine-type recombinase/integrase [Kingella negevensis]|uniref:tyrosine-type recombinase/integrase n=1 Tax=Kingella negevensis TaxID=1522312 RepID=UPI00254F1752|nr:tyrosine-type recombinase/integrase [Kingella negevensis]MDK4689168.1 tyrosine-type recombinase/integrase [Kingella negevensis]